MNAKLYDMLYSEALADKKKALLTLDLLGNNPAGIGDHSTTDFYNNANEALQMLVDSNDKLETLKKEFGGIHEKVIL
jgi:hypothetical protein